MTEKEICHFFKNIICRLGYCGWKLKIVYNSSEGYCWKWKRTIDIGIDNRDCKNLLLHEISHIDTCRFCNNKHHIEFWRRYEDLIRRFLPSGIPSNRYNEDVGYFEIGYGS